MGTPITDKKKMRFSSLDSLKQVDRVINEAKKALEDKTRTADASEISDLLAGAAGALAGGAIGWVGILAMAPAGVHGAAMLTSGLAGLGGFVGGGMLAGMAVAAAPVAILTGAAVYGVEKVNFNKLMSKKIAIYNDVVAKQNALIKELDKLNSQNVTYLGNVKERIAYLEKIITLLQAAETDLEYDLGYES